MVPLCARVVVLACLALAVRADYFIGDVGKSCSETCFAQNMNCNPHIVTGNTADLFQKLGVQCTANPQPWWAEDQPSFVANASDPNSGECLGYINVPGGVLCAGSYPTTRRLCRCDKPSTSVQTFGTGLSSGMVTTKEQWVFQHVLAAGDVGVMTHFWVTYGTEVDSGVIVRYYIDGETNASIAFRPSVACGVGYFDNQAPWGTKWFGKGAKDGGWFWNFRVPFQRSVVVTVAHETTTYGGFYMIVRGGTNIPLRIGEVAIPPTARLQLFKAEGLYQPLDYVQVANVPSGNGLFFMHTLVVSSGNANFLEGCYRMFTGQQEWPGTVLSTGTEDYFDSAWYFNAGEFHLPVAGYTHLNTTIGIQWSAYRFHEMDPLQFNQGFRMQWRVGDTNDPAGMKCYMQSGGSVVGSPTPSNVTSYGWVYTW